MLAAAGVCDAGSAMAQTFTTPSVIVDESVLERLGPPIALTPVTQLREQEASASAVTERAGPTVPPASAPKPPAVKPASAAARSATPVAVSARPVDAAPRQGAPASRETTSEQQTSQLLPPPERAPQSTLTLPGQPPQTFPNHPPPAQETAQPRAPREAGTGTPAPLAMPKVTAPQAPRSEAGTPAPASAARDATPEPAAEEAAVQEPTAPAGGTTPVQEMARDTDMPVVAVPPKPVEPSVDSPATDAAAAPEAPAAPAAPELPPPPKVVAPVAGPEAPTRKTEAAEAPKTVAPAAPAQAEAAATPLPLIIPPRGAEASHGTASTAAQVPAAVPPAASPSPSSAAIPPMTDPAATEPRPSAPAATSPAKPDEPRSTESERATTSKPAAENTGQVASLPPPAKEAAPPEVLDGGSLYRIPFASESSEIPEISEKHLLEIARRMRENENLRLQLLGYADGETETSSAARRMSLFRALAVRTYLMKHGIRSTRVDVRALGAKMTDGTPDRVDAVFRN